MEEKNTLVISDSELIQYLEMAHKMLTAAKSELDTSRLKEIISALKYNDYQIKHQECSKPIPKKKDVQIIIDYLEKVQEGRETTFEEEGIFKTYCDKNRLLRLAVNQSYEELYSELSLRKSIPKSEITVIYQYLTGQTIKTLSSDKMVDQIKQYIYKLKNFSDMDARFAEKKYTSIG